ISRTSSTEPIGLPRMFRRGRGDIATLSRSKTAHRSTVQFPFSMDFEGPHSGQSYRLAARIRFGDDELLTIDDYVLDDHYLFNFRNRDFRRASSFSSSWSIRILAL